MPSSITHHLLFWTQLLSLILELPDSAGLTGQQAPGMVSVPPVLAHPTMPSFLALCLFGFLVFLFCSVFLSFVRQALTMWPWPA